MNASPTLPTIAAMGPRAGGPLLLLLLLIHTPAAESKKLRPQVHLGLDFGSQYMKAAVEQTVSGAAPSRSSHSSCPAERSPPPHPCHVLKLAPCS